MLENEVIPEPTRSEVEVLGGYEIPTVADMFTVVPESDKWELFSKNFYAAMNYPLP